MYSWRGPSPGRRAVVSSTSDKATSDKRLVRLKHPPERLSSRDLCTADSENCVVSVVSMYQHFRKTGREPGNTRLNAQKAQPCPWCWCACASWALGGRFFLSGALVAAALFARAVGLAWMLVLFGIKCLTAAPVPSATVTGNSLLGNPGVPRDVLAARTAGAGSCAAGKAAALPLLLLCVASCKHLVSSSCASPASEQLHTPASPATGQGHNGQ